jgi:peptide/nickel transport system substrate-binding protein
VTSPPETLDPRYATDAVGLRATRLVHAGLFGIHPETLAPVPVLAASYAFEGPLKLHVKLRNDARFHGGKPLSAGDVVATISAFKSPAVASRHAKVLEAIDHVEADGPLDVTFTLSRPHATLLTDLELPVLREDEAHGPPAPDGTLDALRLHAGRADVVQNAFSPTLLPSFEDASAGTGLRVVTRPGASVTYLLPRCDRGPLGDARVRRAISLGLDRELFARALFAGHARPASAVIPPGHWAAPRDFPNDKRDVDAARALLRGASAEHLTLTLLVSTDRARKLLARVMAEELAEIGVTVEVVSVELGTLLARLGKGDFELALLQLPELIEPNVLRTFLHGSNVPPVGSNRGRVVDPELDALLDEGDAVLDTPQRAAVYARLERLVHDRAYLLPIVHEDHVAVLSARASGYVPARDGRLGGLVGLP